jgi:glycosyltransferase involved in cell wall biosynthesis
LGHARMTKAGLVSVVIPTFNYANFVVEAVESALQQTYQSLEIIVVDDGSTDDTRQRLKPFVHRIHYVYQNNRGLSAARNTGIRLANGEWIALLDSDDLWHPEKTEVQLLAARHVSEVGIIGSLPARSLSQLREKLPADPEVSSLSVRDFMLSSRTGTTGALIRRQCFDVVGLFDEELRSIEDRDMWLRIAARFPVIQVSTPCWWYRPHAGQMSRRAARMVENYKKVLTKFFDHHPEHASLRRLAWSYLYVDGAWTYLDEGDERMARVLMWKSVRLWPWSFGDHRLRKLPRARIIARLVLGEKLFRKIPRILPSNSQ